MDAPPLPRATVPHPHVRCDATVLSGSPHVVGTRIPVRRLWAWHRSGTSIETLFRRYPALGPAKLLDALAFAYDNLDVIQADLDREQALLDASTTRGSGRPTSQLPLPFAAPAAPISAQAMLAATAPPAEIPPPKRARAGRR